MAYPKRDEIIEYLDNTYNTSEFADKLYEVLEDISDISIDELERSDSSEGIYSKLSIAQLYDAAWQMDTYSRIGDGPIVHKLNLNKDQKDFLIDILNDVAHHSYYNRDNRYTTLAKMLLRQLK